MSANRIPPLVSYTARRLSESYGEKIDSPAKLDEVLNQILNSVIHIDPNLKSTFEKIITGRLGDYRDPISRVSTRELLALVWLGIHDESKLLIQDDDVVDEVQRVFIRSIFENRAAICSDAFFMIILSGLEDVHQDIGPFNPMSIQARIQEELQTTVLSETKRYLDNLSPKERQQLIAAWDRKEEFDGLDPPISYNVTFIVWNAIKDQVAAAMRRAGYQDLYDISGLAAAPRMFGARDNSFAKLLEEGIFLLEKNVGGSKTKMTLDQLLEPYRTAEEEKKETKQGPPV